MKTMIVVEPMKISVAGNEQNGVELNDWLAADVSNMTKGTLTHASNFLNVDTHLSRLVA